MPEPLDQALDRLRSLLVDPSALVRAVAAGRRRGRTPAWKRAVLRPVTIKAGPRLQVELFDEHRPTARNVTWPDAAAEVDALLAEPYGNWHVETAAETIQLRVTKKGDAVVHRSPAVDGRTGDGGGHDRTKSHLLDPDDPLYDLVGGTAAKRRQVDAFLRALAAVLGDDVPDRLAVVDLGCGNAYLSFAAHRYLSRAHEVSLTGVDVRPDQRDRNTELAARLGGDLRFVAGTIADARVDEAPDVVLALHACDTATDEALARAVRWRAPYVLAAPCCHHDIAAQLRAATPAFPGLTRHGILRERFADVLTDALRAALLRLHGYRVDVVEFVDSAHTPRNLLLRARYTGATPTEAQRAEYRMLVDTWGVTPRLAVLLVDTWIPDA